MRGVPATPAANPVATQTLARSQTSPPLQSWPRAKSWPAETDPQLESIAHIAVEGAMRALRIRDQALRGLGIPTEGPRAPALDPLATWPRPDQAARRLVSSDPAQRLPLEPLASAFWEIGVHEAATLAAIRAACDALIAHLAPRRGAEGQLRALFATEFANTYAAHIYRLRSSPPRV
jgi:hypothetical protein